MHHPRTSMMLELLTQEYSVDFYRVSATSSFLKSLNLLTFRNFDLACLSLIPRLKNYDIIFLQNIHVLPLSFFSKVMKKTIVYDSLDVYPYHNAYNLEKKYRLPSALSKVGSVLFSGTEKVISRTFCDHIIVNSDYLVSYYKKAQAIYYTSPLEGRLLNNPSKPAALLYLGIFSPEKGSREIIEFCDKLGVELYIFGEMADCKSEDIIHRGRVHWVPRLKPEQLITELGKVMQSHFLYGMSLANDANFNYAVQELNKEIDYLSIGIPLIGNHRLETAKKIQAGGGLFWEDIHDLASLDQPSLKISLMNQSLSIYQDRYSYSKFVDQFTKIKKSL